MIKLLELYQSRRYHYYLDLDGVLCAFEQAVKDLAIENNLNPNTILNSDEKWKLINQRGVSFWAEMDWMPDGQKLWNLIKKLDPTVEILTAKPRLDYGISKAGKIEWVKSHLGQTVKCNVCLSNDKQQWAEFDTILIDDKPSNIQSFTNKGGIGILYTTFPNLVKDLKALNLI